MKITTEQLLVSADGFGLTTATPVQRAACRVRDGLPLRELASDPQVIAAFGGEDAIRQLPSERGIKPTRFYNIASPRTAKTTIAVAGAVADSLNADLSDLGPGEVARTSYLSLTLDVADIARARAKGLFEHSAVLRPLFVPKTADMFMVKRPSDNQLVEFTTTAGGRAAGGIAGRWQCGVLFDEGPKMASRSDGAVTNIEDGISVALERLVPGAAITVIGSPWAPHGHCYDIVESHFGAPTDDIVVMRTTGPAGNPHYWTPERIEKLDEIGQRIVRDGEFIDPESGHLSPVSISTNTRETPLELPPSSSTSTRYSAAADPSDGAAGGNGFALCVVQTVPGDPLPKYRVVLAREWRGLNPKSCWEEIAGALRPYGINSLSTDQFSGGASVDLAKDAGLHVTVQPSTAATNIEDWQNVATLLHSDRLELAPHHQLLADLKGVKRRATHTGFTIVLPRVGGRHADLAAAMCAALAGASAGGAPMTEAQLQEMRDMSCRLSLEIARDRRDGWGALHEGHSSLSTPDWPDDDDEDDAFDDKAQWRLD